MEIINHIDTLIVQAITLAWDTLTNLNLGDLEPARIDQFINNSPLAANWRSVLRLVGVMFCLVFGGVLAVAVSGKRALSGPKPETSSVPTEESVSVAPTGHLRDKWTGIMGHLDSANENDWKSAVLEADKIVDSALQTAGFPGDTFGDRLTNIEPSTLISLDGLWWAHRIRNRVAHEMDFFLRYTEARQAVSYFQATLEELKMI
jgi:hypothetical protein